MLLHVFSEKFDAYVRHRTTAFAVGIKSGSHRRRLAFAPDFQYGPPP